MSDSYSEHTRIALDILEKTQDDVNYITDLVLKIKKACKGEAPFSTHSICADAEEWASVVEVDPYFKDVKVIDSFVKRETDYLKTIFMLSGTAQ